MKKIFLMATIWTLLIPSIAIAQDYTSQLNSTGTAVYQSSDSAGGDLMAMIGMLIKVLLSVLGVVLLVMIIYGGFLWMTAGGNETQVKKAKDIMQNAIIGVLILFFSYAISNFVLKLLIS